MKSRKDPSFLQPFSFLSSTFSVRWMWERISRLLSGNGRRQIRPFVRSTALSRCKRIEVQAGHIELRKIVGLRCSPTHLDKYLRQIAYDWRKLNYKDAGRTSVDMQVIPINIPKFFLSSLRWITRLYLQLRHITPSRPLPIKQDHLSTLYSIEYESKVMLKLSLLKPWRQMKGVEV